MAQNEAKEQFDKFMKSLQNLEKILERDKANNRQVYWTPYDKPFKKESRILQEAFHHLKKFLLQAKDQEINDKLTLLQSLINNLLTMDKDNLESDVSRKLSTTDSINKEIVDIKIFIEGLEGEKYEIPENCPEEIKIVLEEAIGCHNHNYEKASVVMSRNAYETLLNLKFREVQGKEPIESIKCPKCGHISGEKPMGLVKLHKWALEEGFIDKKYEKIGYLISEFAVEGAHPFGEVKPEDADLAIRMDIFLLKKIKK